MTIWIHRIFRWALGALFIVLGIVQGRDWYTIAFGAIILATGFLRPCRCIGDSCKVPSRRR